MPKISVDPSKVQTFANASSFNDWLALHHDSEDEIWIKIHKVKSGLTTITPAQAVDVVLCWGWIDAIRKSHDDVSFLQRYTPRGPRSVWSKINVDNVARLIAEGRMTEHGLHHVESAKADGRWERAYASGKDLKIPHDLQQAIEQDEAAHAMLAVLTEQNRFALAFRMHTIKTPAARARNIERYVAMLARGETIYPQRKR
ncbi:YdeI/OmpD-associated family protein [Tianweitania sp. BSSL-BM11]|uniref:YdeI/OmpD-associated family protein n=1 Tax=Tianweitania aestuarii TaxID=2814886 RepID=A0ABS5RTK1_9HYPH|nr:YdeI/OmpD-associated family protein [Tianweitania aestuarii]MBS9720381.1 YdeI/OmpD-associated family protein [Tianweitania aestuarii]